jgi:hypothetical protein
MALTSIGEGRKRSATLDALVGEIHRERAESKPSAEEVTRGDVEAIVTRLAGNRGFFTHIRILVEIGAFSGTLSAIFAITCRGTRNVAIYTRILAYVGYCVEISGRDTEPAEQPKQKVPSKVAAALDRLDLYDTFTRHENELNRVSQSFDNPDIQRQISGVTQTNLLALRTSPVARGEFVQGAQTLLRAIAAEKPEGAAIEKTTELYGHCEALLIMATALDSGGIYADRHMKVLGSGAFNSTFLFAAGNAAKKVFKPMSIEKVSINQYWDNLFNTRTGINLYNAANRNLGTCAVAKLFGYPELVVGTRLAVVNGQVGISMDRARGISVFEAAQRQGIDLRNDSEFQRQCTQLQLLDCVIGNIDRHKGNLNWDGKAGKLMAFDNDMTFIDGDGRSFGNTVPECLYFSLSETTWDGTREVIKSADGKSPRNYCYPPIIGEEMREKILALSEESLRDVLQESGLEQAQIDAACSRLKCLKERIQDSTKVTVIPTDDWGKNIPAKCHWYNTYFMAYTSTESEQREHRPPESTVSQ